MDEDTIFFLIEMTVTFSHIDLKIKKCFALLKSVIQTFVTDMIGAHTVTEVKTVK